MTGLEELTQGLARALARIGLPAPQGLERLSGGANMESWRFSAGAEICVLRRAPSAEMMAGRGFGLHAENHLKVAQVVVVELASGDFGT